MSAAWGDKSYQGQMNLTTEVTDALNVTLTFEQNVSSLQIRDIDILGPFLFWAYQVLHTIEGILAIVANLITLIVIYRYVTQCIFFL